MAKKEIVKKKLSQRKKQAVYINRKSGLILSAAFFCNAVSKSESGKYNCQDIFTSFLAWAYPTAFRSWFAILTVYNLPLVGTTIAVSISRYRGKKTTLASVDIKREEEDLGTIINIHLHHKFQNEGLHFVHFNVVGTTEVLNIPFNVVTRPWPKFSQKDLKFLKNNPSIPHTIRVNVSCSNCSNPYTFEENVLSKGDLVGNVLPFPDSGLFECNDCGHKLNLKDIQGQLRSSIKTAVSTANRGDK